MVGGLDVFPSSENGFFRSYVVVVFIIGDYNAIILMFVHAVDYGFVDGS